MTQQWARELRGWFWSRAACCFLAWVAPDNMHWYMLSDRLVLCCDLLTVIPWLFLPECLIIG